METATRKSIKLCITLLAFILLNLQTATPNPGNGIVYSFYAVYDRILDSETQGMDIDCFAFSDDGRKIILGGTDKVYKNPLLYMINTDGSSRTKINLPAKIDEILSVAISDDGSVAYIFDYYFIYRVEGDNVTEIFNVFNEHFDGIYDWSMKTTASGDMVFFVPGHSYDVGSIWSIDSNGGGLTELVYCRDVDRDGGKGGGMGHYDISDDGSKIAFILNGYFDNENKYHAKGELFLKDGSGVHQLTNDNDITLKGYPCLSDEGNIIVFYCINDKNLWYSIHTDGLNRTPVSGHGSNFCGADITHDGSVFIHGEGDANGGKLVSTDGSASIEIFPDNYPQDLQLYIWSDVQISADGKKTAFLYDATENDIKVRSLYVGYFNNPFAVPDAPLIESITFNPNVIPKNNPDAEIILNTRISDPQGLGDLWNIVSNEMVDGEKLASSYVPVYFRWEPNDEAEEPDVTAGDGIYSTLGEPRSIIGDFDRMRLRIGVWDNSMTVVVADTVFYIQDYGLPGIPGPVIPANMATDVIHNPVIAWTGSDTASFFQLQISEDDDMSPTVLDEEVDDTLFVTPDLDASTIYYWRVRGYNPGGYSEWSETYSFTTMAATWLPGTETGNMPGLIVDQNFPNPFTAKTGIDFYISTNEYIQLRIYDELGRMIYVHSGNYCTGKNTIVLDLGILKKGVYYYQFIAGDDVVMKKMKKM
ncbi:MAG: T9SS type A sorting domain-containing protein [Bacteroidales bacterium]|nr:T9SS type A sorting domain-containing protein [Bacteroidales bacterium]